MSEITTMVKLTGRLATLAGACLVWAVSNGVQADINVNVNGIIMASPSCTINDDNMIGVDFGSVVISKIDGENYSKPVDYGTISCGPGVLPAELKLSINGTPTDFDPFAIQSSVTELGIRILQNGVLFELNTPLLINYTQPPVLQAVLVKNAGVPLNPGAFTAAATLLAEYE